MEIKNFEELTKPQNWCKEKRSKNEVECNINMRKCKINRDDSLVKVKVKQPLQIWSGPGGSRKLRLPGLEWPRGFQEVKAPRPGVAQSVAGSYGSQIS